MYLDIRVYKDGEHLTDFDVSYSPMNYCYNVVNRDTTAIRTDDLKNLIKELSRFNYYAKVYTGEIEG